MPRVIHVVVTDAFAGVERYVCDVGLETASRGWDVVVVGGQPQQMRQVLGDRVRWRPGATLREAMTSLLRLGRSDICHAHMTAAEAVAVGARRFHRSPIVSTRHFAAQRGASRPGRAIAPWIARHLAREIAISEFVAAQLERPPSAVILSGVPASPLLWNRSNRTVLVLQRLESEKDTLSAVRAWRYSGLAEEGWSLRIVGEGSQREMLEGVVESEAIGRVSFIGWAADVATELRRAGILLASAPAEPLGLAVLEAMAAGVPVVASAAGGHLETTGLLPNAPMFAPRDGRAGGVALRSLRSDETRGRLSAESRRLVEERFPIKPAVDRLLGQYEAAQDDRGIAEVVASRPDLREPRRGT